MNGKWRLGQGRGLFRANQLGRGRHALKSLAAESPALYFGQFGGLPGHEKRAGMLPKGKVAAIRIKRGIDAKTDPALRVERPDSKRQMRKTPVKYGGGGGS